MVFVLLVLGILLCGIGSSAKMNTNRTSRGFWAHAHTKKKVALLLFAVSAAQA
jgi:hypothetical protein